MVVRVRLSESTRWTRDWAHCDGQPGSWKAKLKRYVRSHGAGMALRYDGSGVLFFADKGKIRQKTFPEVVVRS